MTLAAVPVPNLPPGAQPDEAVCPCDRFVHPRSLGNPPGLPAVAYRIGDFLSFRHALLLALPGEAELSTPDGPVWRPAPGDLGLQMAEWWAVCADILTFYNERIANQFWLGTADRPESLQRLIRLLGYRPRPGIGAHGTLAAVLSGPAPVTLPAGFPVQSKPPPGKQPQIFELNADTTVPWPAVVTADPLPSGALAGADGNSVLLSGRITGVKRGDELLLLPRGWAGESSVYQRVTVQSVTTESDPRGRPLTRVGFAAAPALPAGARAQDYRLLRSVQTTRLWPHDTGDAKVVGTNGRSAVLDAPARAIQPGDPVLFEVDTAKLPPASPIIIGVLGSGSINVVVPTQPQTTLVSVVSYSEAVWYVVGDKSDPSKPPNPLPANFIPVGLLRGQITFGPALTGDAVLWDNDKSFVTIRYDWRDVGTLVPEPARSLDAASPRLRVPQGAFPPGTRPMLLEAADGTGTTATATVLSDAPGTVSLSDLPDATPPLAAPVKLLAGLLRVSRGRSVTGEVLGSGDARIPGQSFALQKAPLTYLQDPASVSGDNYSSTLRVLVNGVAWREVPNFYGQPADAQIFATREDESGKTLVLFGDGEQGARLPTGVNNVAASYRYGSGAEVPAAGTLTVLARPWPGLQSLRNPVAVGGGADPDPPERIRTLAPRSVLTFGRAVSLDDHAAIALAAPGVSRARAEWAFDGATQRAAVAVWVGDDAAARESAQAALDAAIDPNRPVRVRLATPMRVQLAATILVDPRRAATTVLDAVRAALIGPGSGLFGAARMGIGQSVYDSQIYAACLEVPGARAVHGLTMSTGAPPAAGADASICRPGRRHDPSAGGFLALAAADLDLTPTPDDGARPND